MPQERGPRVVATANLTDNSAWYLFGPPAQFPVIGRVRLIGSPETAVEFASFEAARRREPTTGEIVEYPGVALPASHSVGFSILSRIGAVKLTKT